MIQLLDRLLPPELPREQRLRARLIVAILGATAIVSAATVAIAVAVMGERAQPVDVVGMLGATTAASLGLALVRANRLDTAVSVFLGLGWIVIQGHALVTGGLGSASFVNNAVLIVFAAVLGRVWQAAALVTGSIGAGVLFFLRPELTAEPLLGRREPIVHLFAAGFHFVLIGTLVSAMAMLRDHALALLHGEQRDLRVARERIEQSTVSTNYMRGVLASVRDMILVTDTEGAIVDLNPAVPEQLGYTRDELLTMRLADLSDIAELTRAVRVRAHPGRLRRADGRTLPVVVSRGRLEAPSKPGGAPSDGPFRGFVWAATDTTAQEAAVEAVRRAHDQAEAANLAKSRFLANMSHELRTPLNAIIGYAELLADELSAAGHLGDLERIREAGKHLLQLINGILDLSKVEAGKERLDVSEVQLASLIDGVAATTRPLLRAGVRLVVQADVQGSARLDESKTRQVLLNLLGNAAKFTHSGEVRLEAARWDREGMPWLRLAIVDTGIGMDGAQLERIFEPFAQADGDTGELYGGTGLGLSISRALVRMMGGEIHVESVRGEGTRFTVEIPVGELRQLRTPGRPARTDMPQRDGGRLVLCIDDDRSALELLSRLLTTDSRQVVGTTDPEQGLAWADTLRPDLVTVDVQMPRMSGWNVLAQLAQHPHLRSTPTLVITAEGEEPVARALGASAVLRKPVDRASLEAAVEQAMASAGDTPVRHDAGGR